MLSWKILSLEVVVGGSDILLGSDDGGVAKLALLRTRIDMV